jgi:uncharacterized membrane protein (UPF0127 family)
MHTLCYWQKLGLIFLNKNMTVLCIKQLQPIGEEDVRKGGRGLNVVEILCSHV